MINRRRFLAISAAFAATPALGATQTWQGRGLGAALSVQLVGVDAARAARVWHNIEAVIARIESAASLYADSALLRLNRDGHLAWPAPDLAGLMALSDRVNRATQGAFDPSVQPLWQAIARGGDTAAAARLVGWAQVRHDKTAITLRPGMALTLNGVAQGWAADRVADVLRDMGFHNVLVDMGEVMALGQTSPGTPWRAAIASPNGKILGQTALTDRALATSSPRGTLIGTDRAHILHPQTGARWQTVAVSAPSAAVADALSTAFCLMPRAQIDAALAQFAGARIEVLA
jgi:thiamine biosynthesis lipoprotein